MTSVLPDLSMNAPSKLFSTSSRGNFEKLIVESESEENLWLKTLAEARQQSASRHVKRNLIVVGEPGSGKHTLVEALKSGGAVEGAVERNCLTLGHQWIAVRDEGRDESTNCDVWIVEQPKHLHAVFDYGIEPADVKNAVFCVVLSLTRPWVALEALNGWVEALNACLEKMGFDEEEVRKWKRRREVEFMSYVDPGSIDTGSSVGLGLGEHALELNNGLDVMVFVTKADRVNYMESELNWRDADFDFFQLHLRKWCVRHGAALFYTSARSARNIGLAIKYIAYKLCSRDELKKLDTSTAPNEPETQVSKNIFPEAAHFLEKDDIFIPIGWDNERKISVLADALTSFAADQTFEQAMKPLSSADDSRLDDSLNYASSDAENDFHSSEQNFLRKVQKRMAESAKSHSELQSSSANSSLNEPAQADEQHDAISASAEKAQSSAEKTPKRASAVGGTPGSGSNEAALSTFFNSLLGKKTASSGSPSPRRKLDG